MPLSPVTFVFLVVEQDIVVATDISEAIRQVRPDADVRLVSPQAVEEGAASVVAATGTARVAQAFIATSPLLPATRAFCEAVTRRGGTIVSFVDSDEEASVASALGWQPVLLPFAADDLLPLIRRAPVIGVWP